MPIKALISFLIAPVLLSCSHSEIVSDVPKVFVGDFCMTDILSDYKFVLRMASDSVFEETKEGKGQWDFSKSAIVKILHKDWNRISVYTKNERGKYFRYTLIIEEGNLIVYRGFLLDKTEEENVTQKQLDWDDSRIGTFHKCDCELAL